MAELYNVREKRNARSDLRQNQTPAETQLWSYLRGRQLDGAKFRRQYSIGDYIVDFYCGEARLIVELDGHIHNNEEQSSHDKRRDEYLTTLGLKVLRFPNQDVLQNLPSVLSKIQQNLDRA
ncbi:MAG TPA: endonuclease domain-containing protein [Capsulimonadaceae bacterium]|jgi:very-short-patch-repair endonuclease